MILSRHASISGQHIYGDGWKECRVGVGGGNSKTKMQDNINGKIRVINPLWGIISLQRRKVVNLGEIANKKIFSIAKIKSYGGLLN